jgi:hypothetical protein
MICVSIGQDWEFYFLIHELLQQFTCNYRLFELKKFFLFTRYEILFNIIVFIFLYRSVHTFSFVNDLLLSLFCRNFRAIDFFNCLFGLESYFETNLRRFELKIILRRIYLTALRYTVLSLNVIRYGV